MENGCKLFGWTDEDVIGVSEIVRDSVRANGLCPQTLSFRKA